MSLRRNFLERIVICFWFAQIQGFLRDDSSKIDCAYTTWDKYKRVQVIFVKQNENDTGPSYEIPFDYTAVALFQNRINQTGWAFLMVQTNQRFGDEDQAYAAGFLEAILTHELMYMHWFNTLHDICNNRAHVCHKIQNYLNMNLKWVQGMIAKHSSSQPYWYQINLVYKQLKGLADGYRYKTKGDPSRSLTFNDLLWLNIQGDLEDLLNAFDTSNDINYEPFLMRGARLSGSRSCSALIKLLSNTLDLYTAHTTWASFQSMLRIQKKYIFPFRILENTSSVIPGYAISFSSYPGEIQSGDDFYITSEGLTILETAIGNNNHSLYQHVKPEGQVLGQIRAIVANRLANCGRCWCKFFSQYNSGTHNNQWMVVDYKLFKMGTSSSELNEKLLWVLEQLPGYIRYEDKTEVLRQQSYWPSYNIPYYPDIFKMGGNAELVSKHGNWFNYDENPRAFTFRREHETVQDTASMMTLMRSNDYKNDPFSKCNCTPPHSGQNAIAARNDVNSVNSIYPFPALGLRSHGTIDMKLTTADLVYDFQFIAYSGPTRNANLPPFQWSTSDFKALPHIGHPDVWDFGPVLYRWEWN